MRAWWAAIAVSACAFAFAQQRHAPDHLLPGDLDRGALGLARELRELNTRASMLMITAHPDDEDGGLLAWASRGLGARVSLMTLTRGEGGQDAVSPDMYDALGLLRTQELLASDRDYGVDQYWSSVIDYGFSKTREEAWQKWGRDRVLGDVVRVIRMTRPMILVSVFAGAPTDGHGNHQVAGEVTQEAFLAAGDPTKFPEQIREGLQPWSPLKVYAHVPFFSPTKEGIYDYATDEYVPVRFFDYVHQRWIEGKPSTDAGIEEGTRDPITGLTFRQIGRKGLATQRTQGHGGMIPLLEDFVSEYHLYGTHVESAKPEHDLFAGVDTSLEASAEDAQTRAKLHEISKHAAGALATYRPDRPHEILGELATGLHATRELLAQSSLPNEVRFELQVKERQFESALAHAAGVSLSAVVAPPAGFHPGPFSGPEPTFTTAIPGQTFRVSARVSKGADAAVQRVNIRSAFGEDWQVKQDGEMFQVTVPEHAEFTKPYFSRPDEEQPYYNIDDPRWRNRSFAPYPLIASAEVNIHGEPVHLEMTVEAIHRENAGPEADPLLVEPAISISVSPRAGAVPLSARTFQLTCDLHSNVKGPASGTVRLQLPSGWELQPDAAPFSVAGDGAAGSVTFSVTPRNIQAKAYDIKAVAEYGGKQYAQGYRMVGYPGLREYPYFRPASYKAVGVDVTVAPKLKVAFVPGTGDEVPRALEDLGVPVTVVQASDVATRDLSGFDAVILGVRAYAVRPELREANWRLLEYVKNGGTLIVQYNLQKFDGSLAPYPFSLGSNAAKVVDETAPVQVDATNPLFAWPNTITSHDFDGWQEERGHGFLHTWDLHYSAPTETHDPGQPAQRGGLLIAHYGQGLYIYDAFALYRQLPDGVPGAYRILANLISAGQNSRLKQ